jgi:hypothetical protein
VKTSLLEIEAMSNISGRHVRIGFVALAAMILTASFAGDAVAGHRAHTVHFRALKARAQYVQNVPVQGNPGPNAMRYYGGPKSPMWRGPVEN